MTDCRICHATTDAFACHRCGEKVERLIGDMPALFAELDVTISRQSRTYRASTHREPDQEWRFPVHEARHKRHERADGTLMPNLRSSVGRIALRAFSMPVDLDAAEVRWAAWNTLTTWARHLAESRGAEPPSDDRLVGWLLFNIDAIRFDEAAAEIIDEIGYAHASIERAIDRSPERLYAGPCRASDGETSCVRDLYATPGKPIVCDGHRSDGGGCRAEFTWDERRDWLRDDIEDRLLPLADLIDALPVLIGLPLPPAGTWRSWQSRGRSRNMSARLVPHHVEHDGRELFRGGDVLDLVVGWRGRAVAS